MASCRKAGVNEGWGIIDGRGRDDNDETVLVSQSMGDVEVVQGKRDGTCSVPRTNSWFCIFIPSFSIDWPTSLSFFLLLTQYYCNYISFVATYFHHIPFISSVIVPPCDVPSLTKMYSISVKPKKRLFCQVSAF